MFKVSRVIVIAMCVSLAVITQSWVDDRAAYTNESSKRVVVEIDYGGLRPSKTVEVLQAKDKTILEPNILLSQPMNFNP